MSVAAEGPVVTVRYRELVEKVLLSPMVVSFVPFEQLARYSELGKMWREVVIERPEDIGYWPSMCVALSAHRGLFTLFDVPSMIPARAWSDSAARGHFANELWPCRHKFDPSHAAAVSNAIKVAVRFRPEDRGHDNLTLPLHQFLKVKRKALKPDEKLVVGPPADPEEFLDPFMNVLMKDPVRVTTVNKVCDRSVAVASVIRRGRCPFSGRKITMEHLQPVPELAERIAAWRAERTAKGLGDVSVTVAETQSLVDEGAAMDPALLELAQEVERMAFAAEQAKRESTLVSSRLVRARARAGAGENEADDEGEQPLGPETTEGQKCLADSSDSPPLDDSNAQPSILDVIRSLGGARAAAAQDDTGLFSNRAEKPRVLEINTSQKVVSVCEPGAGVRPYHFGQVYDGRSSQAAVFEETGRAAVHASLNGINSTLLCYGQTGKCVVLCCVVLCCVVLCCVVLCRHFLTISLHTSPPFFLSLSPSLPLSLSSDLLSGSGKTFTFFGPEGALDKDWGTSPQSLPADAGLLARSLVEVLSAIEPLSRRGVRLSLSAQYIEIFEEGVTDLVSGRACQVRRETGECVGAEEVPLASVQECVELLRMGQQKKRFAATKMNERSSRSHSIFLLHLAHVRLSRAAAIVDAADADADAVAVANADADADAATSAAGGGGTGEKEKEKEKEKEEEEVLVRNCMAFVDLAGSERVKKSQVSGARLSEAIGINRSLLILGRCIAALVAHAPHVPYFESRLTTLLKRSFGGNARTCVITCCRQADDYGDETLWSLRFAERCALISNFSKAAASSYGAVVASLDFTLASVREQLAVLEKKGFRHLESYARLEASCQQLEMKRRGLERGAGGRGAGGV